MAAEAAYWASCLFGIEIESKLGQCPCNKKGQDHSSGLEIFVLRDGSVLVGSRPIGYDRGESGKQYVGRGIAFTNLGRTTLTNVTAEMVLYSEQAPFPIPLGNILREQEAHVIVYIARNIAIRGFEIRWRDAFAEARKIKFFPMDPIITMETEAVYELQPRQERLDI